MTLSWVHPNVGTMGTMGTMWGPYICMHYIKTFEKWGLCVCEEYHNTWGPYICMHYLKTFKKWGLCEEYLRTIQSNLPMPLHFCGKQDDAQWVRKFKKVQKKNREIK